MSYSFGVSSVQTVSGPTDGGTLVTLIGRGFSRAAARDATARARHGGHLWWGMNASLAPACRFGGERQGVARYWNDSLIVCVAPARPNSTGVISGANSSANSSAISIETLEVALNAAPRFGDGHFESVGTFQYYEQHGTAMSPSGGPSAGGTLVRLTGGVGGVYHGGGALTACRFGETVVVATGPECVAPTAGVASHLTRVVRFSVARNYESEGCGDHLEDADECALGSRGSFRPRGALSEGGLSEGGLSYVYYPPPVIDAVHPAVGDHRGGVSLTLRGAHLRPTPLLIHGSPRCGFGAVGAPEPTSSTPATFLNESAVRCMSPARARPLAGVLSFEAVSLAINGADYEGGATDGARYFFTYIPPLQPNGSLPAGGPVAGGTLVHVLDPSLVIFPPERAIYPRCRFGLSEVVGTLEVISSGVTSALARRYEPAESRTMGDDTMGDGDEAGNEAAFTVAVVCESPSAEKAGTLGVVKRDFGSDGGSYEAVAPAGGRRGTDETPAEGTTGFPAHERVLVARAHDGGDADVYLGDARPDDGALLLAQGGHTPSRPMGSVGSFVLGRPLTPNAVVDAFDAAFEVFVAGGGGGEGYSFCYGPPRAAGDAPFGAWGTGSGLNVRMLTEQGVRSLRRRILVSCACHP